MILRPVRTTQPQGSARVDWSNPITRGFFVAETPNGQRAAKLTKAVTGGLAFLSDGTSASHLIFPIPDLTLNDFTLFMVGRGGTGSISGAGFALAGPLDFNTNSQASLVFEVWNNTNNWGFDGYTIGIDRQIGVNDGQEHVIAITRVGLSGRFYLDGKLVTTFAFTSDNSISVNLVKLFCKGSGNVDTAESGSYVKTYGAAARALSDNEVKSFSENPWQIFAPDSKSLWVPETVSAGGGATVIPIGVQATGSVGTPSVTGAANALPAGVSATASVGTPTAAGGSSIAATALPAGVAASSAVGAPAATGAAVAQPVGVSAVSAVGVPVAIAGTSIPATVLPTGVQAFGAVGTPTVTAAAIAQPLGVAAIAYVGTPTIATGVSGVAAAYPAGVQAIGQVGALIATGAAWTAAVGVQAVASVGTPSAYAGIQVIYTPGAQTRPSRLQSSSRPSRLQSGTRASR